MSNFDISNALQLLYPDGAHYIQEGFDYDGLTWFDKRPKPSKEQIEVKLVELQAVEPMRLLREERNQKLAVTDWMGNTDIVMSDAWKTHRQALRDLPASANPTLDENGNLTNVTWPEEPE